MPALVERVASIQPQPDDILEVRQGANGLVECFVNGVLALRFVDTTHPFRATAYGLAAVGTATAFDDFTISLPSWR